MVRPASTNSDFGTASSGVWGTSSKDGSAAGGVAWFLATRDGESSSLERRLDRRLALALALALWHRWWLSQRGWVATNGVRVGEMREAPRFIIPLSLSRGLSVVIPHYSNHLVLLLRVRRCESLAIRGKSDQAEKQKRHAAHSATATSATHGAGAEW